jgi:hypothetical protein
MLLTRRLQAITGVLFCGVVWGKQGLGLTTLEYGDEPVVGKDSHKNNQNDQNKTNNSRPIGYGYLEPFRYLNDA